MEEFEIKFLEVDVPKLEKKLVTVGAEKVAEYDYIRVLLDYPDFRLNEKNSWIRLRTDGKETTLTYKERIGVKANDGSAQDDGMKEIEVGVESYEKTFELLKAVGLVVKREERNKRIRYTKRDVVFDIDFWPMIPPYLEIESTSLQKAEEAGRELGFDPKDSFVFSAKQAYGKYGINKDEYSLISFEKQIKK